MKNNRERLVDASIVALTKLVPVEGGKTTLEFSFEGTDYKMEAPMTLTGNEFLSWLPDYAAKTPRCACCSELIFPGQPVTLGHIEPDDSGHSHFSTRCNDTAGGYAGWFSVEGELVSAWEPRVA
ncbi:MAG TPA: hypothetical protein VLG37_00440 [Candidatus Saccharimonadales bacterium]|nr:hypothetical protein [Candidatus Saccharimonadales bacterium]